MTVSTDLSSVTPGPLREFVLVEARDGGAARVVSWAAGWAASERRPLSVVAAHPVPRRHLVVRRRLRRRARLRAELMLAPVRSRYPALQVHELVVWEPSADALARLGDRATVVVMHRAEVTEETTALLTKVAGDAPCPVLVLPERVHHSPEPGRVVLGLDDSPEAWEAAEFAVGVAERWDTELHVLHAWDVRSSGANDPQAARDAYASAARDRIAPCVTRLRRQHPAVSISTESVRGNAARALRDLEGPVGLVVVGSRGRGGASGLRIGSVARELILTAPVPVAVARTPISAEAVTTPGGDRRAPGDPAGPVPSRSTTTEEPA